MSDSDAIIERIAASYDATIEAGNQGIDPYDQLPEAITSHPAYAVLRQGGNCSSGNPAIRTFLDPKPDEKFLDLGCAANIINYRLHEWPCVYFGVDASPATIELLKRHTEARKIEIGGVHCARAERLPFPDLYFDLAACVGVLEYHPAEYAAAVLREAHRVLRPNARFYVDIPNLAHPGLPVMLLMEEHLGRPILLRVSREEFKRLLEGLFNIDQEDSSRVMAGYFLRRL